MADFSLLALKLALQARQAEPPPAPTIDIQPIVDQLEEMKVALGMISRAPRHVAAP